MYNFIIDNFNNGYSMPTSIDDVLCEKMASLYGVDLSKKYNIEYYSCQNKCKFQKELEQLFKNGKVDYNNREIIYALYYLPMNLFKIWTPLTDLIYRKNALKNNINVLDFGAGPGTSTFGLLEFYRNMALEDKDKNFSVSIDIVEKQKNFIKLFIDIYDRYVIDLPDNLKVNVRKVFNKEIKYDFDFLNDNEYDLIYASNVFNENEKNDYQYFYDCCKDLKTKLKLNSSMIFIEPGKKRISEEFKTICNQIDVNNLLSIYSPCGSLYEKNHLRCTKFCVAHVSNINSKVLELINQMLNNSRNINEHSFDYVVFRNDTLRKYKIENKKREHLGNIDWSNLNQKVSIIAIIIACNRRDDGGEALILCDGTIKDNVWLNISKEELIKQGIEGQLLRGEKIDLKNVIVSGNKQLQLSYDTELEVIY